MALNAAAPAPPFCRKCAKLADFGYTEIQLLGQTVNSYRDPSPRRMSFAELLLAVADVPGIRRVRFMTSHPRDLGADIVAAMDAVPALCDHVHLPVQSGSTRILRRHAAHLHSRGVSRESCHAAERPAFDQHHHRHHRGLSGRDRERLRRDPQPAGSPCKYDGVFAFQYSPRPNTPAAGMADAVPEEEKTRRLQELLETAAHHSDRRATKYWSVRLLKCLSMASRVANRNGWVAPQATGY